MTVGYASTRTAFNKATSVNGSSFGPKPRIAPWSRDPNWTALPNPTEGFNALYGVIPDQYSVAFVASGSYVYLKSHGFANNSLISFSVINTTTGISINTTYYVVSVTQDTFQLSLTSGGAALTLTNNGTGTSLTSVSNIVAFTCTVSSGTFSVDWGDGTTTTGVSSGTTVNKTFDYNNATIAANGLTSKSYRQCVVKLTVSVPGALTNINFQIKPTAPEYGTALTTNNYQNWLDLKIAGTSLTSITLYSNQTAFKYLQQVVLLSVNTASFAGNELFRGLTALESVSVCDLPNTVNVYNMFYDCYKLQKAPYFDTTNTQNFTYMFTNCYNLVEVPKYKMSNATQIYQMFVNCYSLTSVPLFDTAKVTNMSYMFRNCYSLTSCPLFNTASNTDFTFFFGSCVALTDAPFFNTSNATTFSAMFDSCTALTTIPKYDTSKGVSFNQMFNNCYSITSIPLLNTSNGTNFNKFLTGTLALQSVPLFDLSKATDMSYMFNGSGVRIVPNFNTANVTSLQAIFNTAQSLTYVPNWNTANCTNFYQSFLQCYSLSEVPLWNTSKATSMDSCFYDCRMATQTLPAWDLSGLTSGFSNIFTNDGHIKNIGWIGNKYGFNCSTLAISKNSLQNMFYNLGKATGAQTITITSCPGADTANTLSGTTTQGSNIIVVSANTGVYPNQLINGTGLGLTTAIAVNFTAANSTVNLVNHQLTNNTAVAFPSITTTTGIITYNAYYVISATSNAFQVANTYNGTAMTLTGDGTGTMIYPNYVVSSNSTAVVMSAPATSTAGPNTLSYRKLDYSFGTLKGFTISG